MSNLPKNDETKYPVLEKEALEWFENEVRKARLREIIYNFVLFSLGVIIPVLFSYFSDILLANIPQQTLTFIITVISILAFVALLVTWLVNSRKKQRAQEKIAVDKIKQKHKDLFAEIQNNMTALLNGEQINAKKTA